MGEGVVRALLDAGAAALGMVFDIWQTVYYSISEFVLLFMLIGSLNRRDE